MQTASEVADADKDDLGRSLTCLVMKDSVVESVHAYAVGKKGAADENWLAKQMLAFLDRLGLNQTRLIVHSDREPSVTALKSVISCYRAAAGKGGTVVEDSAVGDPNANGRVERAIQEVAGVTRTLGSALKERFGCEIGIRHPFTPWLVRHAGQLITRDQVRGSGRTSCRMTKGRDAIQPVCEFGEMVMFSLPKTNAFAKASKW